MMALEKTTTIKRLAYCFKVASRCRQLSRSVKGDSLTALTSSEVALLKCAEGMRSHDQPTCLQRQVAPSKCSHKTQERQNEQHKILD